MASLFALLASSSQDDADKPRKKKKIPMVAVYVSGAAFAVTLGLTALVVPYARQAIRQSTPKSSPVQFLAQRNLSRPSQTSASSSTPSQPTSSSSSSSISVTSDLARARLFNTREEVHLYGSSPYAPQPVNRRFNDDDEDEMEPVEPGDPLMGIKALGIATALVFGSAGLGVFAVAKLLGVNDMESFNAKMREGVAVGMPVMTKSIHGETPIEERGKKDLVAGVLDHMFAALEEEEEQLDQD